MRWLKFTAAGQTTEHASWGIVEGDKVIAIGKQECEDLLHGQLIGDPEAAAAG